MKIIISRCGYKCNLCLAYKENIKSKADREKFRDGLIKYYGYHLTIEECYCDGCMSDDSENPIILTSDCRVRSCVIKEGLENCAHCEQYPCSDLEARFVDGEIIINKFGAPIPDEDYNCFVKPYESRKVLNEIRQKKGI